MRVVTSRGAQPSPQAPYPDHEDTDEPAVTETPAMDEQPESSSAGTVSINRLVVPFAVVLGLVAVIIGGKTWLDSQFYEVRKEVLDLGYEIRAMRGDSSRLTQDRVTGRDIIIWMSRLRAANPTLVIPEISDLLNDAK